MKIFGVTGVLLGIVISVFGVAYIDFIGVVGAINCLGLGFICSAVGVICITTRSLLQRLNYLEDEIANVSKLVSKSRNSTAEETVDQLRQEGLLAPSAENATDRDIETFLD